MKQIRTLLLALVWVAVAAPAFAKTGDRVTDRDPAPTPVVDGDGVLITSNSSLEWVAARETAGPDTFVLYGGPDHPTEGKFQLENGLTPDWGGGNGLPGGGYGGGPNAWTPVDLTDPRVFWHVGTFNAGNLNGNGAGNRAMWCGVPAGDPVAARWVHQPGYGNGWNERLIYESEIVASPSTGQTVQLDLFFNYDTEPDYDFFVVQYDSAGTWTEVLSLSGSNKDGGGVFAAPGVQFSTVTADPIVYVGNDYGSQYGGGVNRIRIGLAFYSDGAWSDEDGKWITDGGAVQVDDISLVHSEGAVFEDFEGPEPFAWRPDKPLFVGDFADVYPRLTDIDPCHENLTPVAGFIDYGQEVRNGPGVSGASSTGGSTYDGIEYGIPGNWVVNYTGGLSFGQLRLTNEVWSPEILWDLPGVVDDDPAISGALIRFDVWSHLPLMLGTFYLWHVRSAVPGEPYGDWVDRNFVYYGGGAPFWQNADFDVSDLIPTGVERVQVALAAWEYTSEFGLRGATPAPCFDNFALYKYRLPGPVIVARTIDTAQDGFPISGSIDVSTQSTRDALDIPFSMARDVNTGDLVNTPGDSIVIDVASIIGASTVTDVRMVWTLQTNPLFEDAIRSAPGRSKDENVVAGAAGTLWSGEVVADTSTASNGWVVEGRYYADLPDVDFMYPGDVLHYYIRATDSDGRASTLPDDISGFGVFGPGATYDRAFTVRGLPTITDTAGTHPAILVINDFGRRGGEDEFTTSFRRLGYAEGVDFDTYTIQGPTSSVSNGIGSAGAHGASVGQLSGYDHIFYFSGNLSGYVLSNGTNWGNNDKSDDIGVLESWHALDPVVGSRNIVYFGDHVSTALQAESPEGLAYMNNIMGVEWIGPDVRGVIGGQTAPVVAPSGTFLNFETAFVAYGGCQVLNAFDQIQPLAGAGVGHYFMDNSGLPISDVSAGVASVVNPGTYGVDITFPYSMMYVYDITGRGEVGLSSRTRLFQEILYLFNAGVGTTPVTSAPRVRSADLSVFPNPFNPSTMITFNTTAGMKGFVKVYNLRGELVRTLHSGEFKQADGFRIVWDGIDNDGATVASGVYLIKAKADGQVQTAKATLVK